MENLIFYDVDTQYDFMKKSGKFYVPGAEGIYENLKQLTQYALNHKIQIFGSVDRHFEGDDELKRFPPHCMDGTEGQKKILETLVEGEEYIENKAYSKDELKQKLLAPAVYFEKQDINVFSNSNASLLENYNTVIVYGVATEYCVKEEVLGLRDKKVDVLVVEDAIQGIDLKGSEKAIKEMKAKGVIFVKTKDILEGNLESLLKNKWRQK